MCWTHIGATVVTALIEMLCSGSDLTFFLNEVSFSDQSCFRSVVNSVKLLLDFIEALEEKLKSVHSWTKTGDLLAQLVSTRTCELEFFPEVVLIQLFQSLPVSGHLSCPAAGSGGGAADSVQSGFPVEGGRQQPEERWLSMMIPDFLDVVSETLVISLPCSETFF